eukprot:CAMPEP_0118636264 /NCGR_PEP_ID=MMETSP0785-20121206/2526_1 /TAXON_ID=91992 /ORGANISM="Bolidomonas pacifica, Strain CCMP 1866" /LENGTH=46 /DNA_ID= /DNA_START= /DNA_END= /DNA_ORIENTATION=
MRFGLNKGGEFALIREEEDSGKLQAHGNFLRRRLAWRGSCVVGFNL